MSVIGNPILLSSKESNRKIGFAKTPYMAIPEGNGVLTAANSFSGDINIADQLSEESIGHPILVICGHTGTISANGLNQLYHDHYITIFYGILTNSTSLIKQASTRLSYTCVEISEDYEPSIYSDLCGYVPTDGTIISTDKLKTANAFKVSALLPQGYGIIIFATPYDFNDSSYQPCCWEKLRLFSTNEIKIRENSGSYMTNGFACFLKTISSEYAQYYIRGGIGSNQQAIPGTLLDPSNFTAINRLEYYREVPTWTNSELSIAYIKLTEKV